MICKREGWSQLSWAAVNSLFVDICPNILQIVDILLTLPVSTAECERSFSIMNLSQK